MVQHLDKTIKKDNFSERLYYVCSYCTVKILHLIKNSRYIYTHINILHAYIHTTYTHTNIYKHFFTKYLFLRRLTFGLYTNADKFRSFDVSHGIFRHFFQSYEISVGTKEKIGN